MPRPAVMEPIRRAGLIEAAITEIGASGSLDVTVAQIARRAGVSSALAHHYFGTKTQIFLSVMRHILALYGAEVRRRLGDAPTPRARLDAILQASFAEENFRPEVVSAWLSFYVRARTSPEIAALLRIYRRRLRSNLVHALKPFGAETAGARAEGIAAMIDGLYLRQGLAETVGDTAGGLPLVTEYVDLLLEDRR